MIIAEPYSPCLAITTRGPSSSALRAARTRFGSSVSCLSSESLSTRQSTSAIVSQQRLVRDVDPEVHRVHRDEPRGRALLAHVALQVGLDVAQEQHLGVARGGRELRLEVLEDVEVRLQRVALVDVAVVAAGPEERLAAGHVLDVVGQHPAVVQDRVLLLAEVVAHRPDDAGLGELRRGEREVHGRAAEQPVAAPGRGLDGVEGDGSDHGERHERRGSLADACAAGEGYLRRMRAIRISEWGGPEVLELAEDAPVPEPGEQGVLVRVTRAGVNFADTHARENTYLARYELPLVPGAEVAGVVERDGHGFEAGQRVVVARRHRRLRRVRRPRPRRRRSRSPTA